MSLPSSMADFVPCDRLLQKAYGGHFALILFCRELAKLLQRFPKITRGPEEFPKLARCVLKIAKDHRKPCHEFQRSPKGFSETFQSYGKGAPLFAY